MQGCVSTERNSEAVSQFWPAGKGLLLCQSMAGGSTFCAAKEASTGDGELPLANYITGAEVWHQLSHRLFLGPRLQPNNAFCLCTNAYTFPTLPSCVQSSLILESWEKWQLFLSLQCLILPSLTVHCHSFCSLHTTSLPAHFPVPSWSFCRLTVFSLHTTGPVLGCSRAEESPAALGRSAPGSHRVCRERSQILCHTELQEKSQFHWPCRLVWSGVYSMLPLACLFSGQTRC